MKRLISLLTILVASSFALNGEHVEQECPVDCHCHYFRINWVTDCSESNLTSIPFEGLSLNVYVLDMNGNNVEHIEKFPDDIKLRRLQMAHNSLTELEYNSFSGLTYLLDADFSYNSISRVDPDAFRDSHGLITLELQHNPISDVSGSFLNCPTLLHFDLNTCGIQHLNKEFFLNTPNLNKLDLSNNPLRRIEPGPFDHLASLEHLQLTSCNLTYISPMAFAHLENLRDLELDNNDLSTLEWNAVLKHLTRLESLNIKNTKIKNLPADAFGQNAYLTKLVLAENELLHLDVGDTLGHNLHNLHSLDLSNCNLQDRLSEEAFRNATKLRSLDLGGNPMFASDLTAVLRHLPQLQKLSLNNCHLRKLPEAFASLVALQDLDVSHNPLDDAFVHLLTPLKSLEYLDMSYCSLGFVANNTFAKMSSLQKLIMSGNSLHTLEEGLFVALTNLKSLELKDCDLKKPLDPKVFGDRDLTDITELNLSKNPLIVPETGALLPKQLSNLESLDLSYCDISYLNKDLFSTTRNLTSLNLSNNRIGSVKSLGSTSSLRSLQHLNLSNNNLTTIDPKHFIGNPNIVTLNLMGNPFVCNCSLADMWNWAVKIKEDLDVLVGSQPTLFSTAKIRRTLTCTYDADTFKAFMDQSRTILRKGDMTPNRTWAKYLREANCPKKS